MEAFFAGRVRGLASEVSWMDGDSSRIAKGLDGVVVDETRISMVDGDAGQIWYAGYDLDELARESSFEEVLALLWEHELPTQSELNAVEAGLGERRALPDELDRLLADIGDEGAPMDVLRSTVSTLATDDPHPRDRDALRAKLRRIVATMPGMIAAMHAHREGRRPVAPSTSDGLAAAFLRMFDDAPPDDRRAEALDTALILYAEHGMNASTFSARVTASTLANPYAAISAAIGTLEGPLHGGATEDVMEVLRDIGAPDAAGAWVDARLEGGDRIPGFGHRVYNVPDPRCKHFKREIEALDPAGEIGQLYETAEALRSVMADRLGEKGIHPNTDLYSGIFFRALGVPPALFTAMFAMGRVAGWAAHVIEQVENNRLIRPRVRYVGDLERSYQPIVERS